MLPELGTAATPPSRLTPPRSDELPHVRFHRPQEDPIEVIFDFRFETELIEILTSLSAIATVHPNVSYRDEFNARPRSDRTLVTIKDSDAQFALVETLIAQSLKLHAQIVVAPELSATREIIDAAQTWVDDAPHPVLLVPGSLYEGSFGGAENRAYGFVRDRQERLEHSKVEPLSQAFGTHRVSREGITGDRRLSVYAADLWRVVILLCKDVLPREGVYEAVVRIGANVVIVPSMSPKTDSYPARVASLAVDNRAFVAVANGPLRWRDLAYPMAVFGQPLEARQLVTASADGRPADARGVILLAAGQTKAAWHRLREG